MKLCNAVLTGHMMHSVGSLPLCSLFLACWWFTRKSIIYATVARPSDPGLNSF